MKLGRRCVTLLEDLPEEIIDMILIWLPPKEVGRCRVVTMSLPSMTPTPTFFLEHRHRQVIAAHRRLPHGAAKLIVFVTPVPISISGLSYNGFLQKLFDTKGTLALWGGSTPS